MRQQSGTGARGQGQSSCLVYFSGLCQWLALVINAERFEDAERVEVVPPVDDLTILDGDD
jgi:hypothetical protein